MTEISNDSGGGRGLVRGKYSWVTKPPRPAQGSLIDQTPDIA